MGATIRQLRRRSSLSMQTLGARIEMHPNYLGELERGAVQNPGLVTVGRIAGGLDVGIGVLAASFARVTEDSSVSSITPAARLCGEPHAGPKELGAALRLLRHRSELTQGDLADRTGVHRGYIAIIEAGEKQNPGLRTLTRIATGLAAGTDDLPDIVADLAQTFSGKLTVASLRTRGRKTSGPPGPLHVPLLGGTGT
jgi:transcriptional regulator with XRE-family HTH domain